MRYWVYMNGEVPGSYEPEELAALPGFGETSMVCPSEGGAEGRNWTHAGQFPDIVDAVRLAKASLPPAAPAPILPPLREVKRVDDILDDSSTRIFKHVSELMQELGNRREEVALTQSLQRQVASLKNEIMALQERIAYLQERAGLIPGFEERENGLQESITRLRCDLQDKDQAFGELGKELKASETELERSRRAERDLAEDVKNQARLAEDLTQQLASKEFSLAKAFSIIRRLETTLAQIMPAHAPYAIPEAAQHGDASAPPPADAVVPVQPENEAPPVEDSVVTSAHEPHADPDTAQCEGASAPLAPIPITDEAPPAPPEPQKHDIPVPWQDAVFKLTDKVRGMFRK